MDSPEKSKRLTDEKLEAMIAAILRAGVLTAAIVVGISGMLYLIVHHADQPRYRTFELESSNLTSVGGILSSARRMVATPTDASRARSSARHRSNALAALI